MRAAARRMNALDPIDQLQSDPALMARAGALFEEIRDTLPPPPPQSLLLEALAG
jgi:hypothetical protein